MNSLRRRPNPKQKVASQSIALLTLGAASVLTWNVMKKAYLSDAQVSSVARLSDPLPNLIGDLYLFLLISFLGVLLGVTCAFYLEEWLPETNWVRCFVESQVGILSGVPSLLYGLLAVTVFLPYSGAFQRIQGQISAGDLNTASLQEASFQGDTPLFYIAVLTFILFVMPKVIMATQEVLRSVPVPIRESAYALGENRWRVLTKHVVPLALPRVIAGACRVMSCALAMAALFIGIYIPRSEQLSDRFALFLGSALLLSIFSSFLSQRYPTSYEH